MDFKYINNNQGTYKLSFIFELCNLKHLPEDWDASVTISGLREKCEVLKAESNKHFKIKIIPKELLKKFSFATNVVHKKPIYCSQFAPNKGYKEGKR